ncbi:MAG: hypothetical protein RLZZ344_849 [Pseudomonadota bacterium]|jgi:uncharacterized protein (TIGR00255 family)
MTVSSMTGFGSAQMPGPIGLVQVDIRSVNNRFFELSLRLPDDLRSLEPPMRERLARLLPRGKVEVRISILREADTERSLPPVNQERVARLLALQSELSAGRPESIRAWSMSELLAFPGVFEAPPTPSEERHRDSVMGVFEAAVQNLEASRQAEGEKLAITIQARLDSLESLRQQAAARMPEALEAQRQKIRARLEEAFGTGMPSELERADLVALVAERIQQEAHAAASRADIAEELDRLKAHLQAMAQALARSGEQPQGKRLDFLCQELHREANTLGAKSASIALTQVAMEMKLTIEQIREQVQNIQ